MNTQSIRAILENRQIGIYFGAVVVAAISALLVPGTTALEAGVNPALALMLFVTFLQVPLADLRRAFARVDFLAALLIANFIAVPLLVAALIQFLPDSSAVRLGVLLVLLTPCIDYVVTFSHLGRADARLLLATTPALLILQMLLLPFYLGLLLGEDAAGLVQFGPFVHAFVWLIAVPLVLAAVVQLWAARKIVIRVSKVLGVLPVPATALVLFVVTAAVVPRLGPAMEAVLRVLPVYIAFAVFAPLIGWSIGRLFRLDAPAGRSVAFSAGTRNSLVVLPLAFAIPSAVPVLPAIIVAQTLVELVSELLYVRFIGKLGPATVSQLRLQRHPTDRAAPGSDLADLRMHGAGIDRTFRDVGLVRSRLVEILLRRGRELRPAACRTKMVGLTVVLEPMLAGRWIDGHPADGVHDRRRIPVSTVMVVIPMTMVGMIMAFATAPGLCRFLRSCICIRGAAPRTA